MLLNKSILMNCVFNCYFHVFNFSTFHPLYRLITVLLAATVAPLYAQYQRSFVPRERAALERNSGNDKMAGRSKLSPLWPT